MKKMFIILMGLIVVSGFAFEQGTINAGGSLSFHSFTENSDADAVTTFTIFPHGGYFFMDNICGDVLFKFQSMSDGNTDAKSTDLAIGIGGRYFYNNIYGGLGFLMESAKTENGVDTEVSGNYLNFGVGYLMPLVENVYVDLGFDYFMGLGKYGGDWDDFDNEESGFELGVGLDIFFMK